MVMNIVSGDQEEQQEKGSDNMDLENNQDNNDECKSYQESEIMNNFFKVINMKPTVAYKVKGIFLIDGMRFMTMNKREKGNVGSEQRFKSLLGRWFGNVKKLTQQKRTFTSSADQLSACVEMT